MRCAPWLVAALAVCLLASPAHPAPLTLERIMADPDWIGPPVERPWWSLDGRSILFSLKRTGSPVRDLHRVAPSGGAYRPVPAADLAGLDAQNPVFDHTRKRAAFIRNGDLFVRELANRQLTQVTRSTATEAAPRFSADGVRVLFRVGNDWYAYDLASRVTGPVALLVAGKDPDEKKTNDLERMQLRLITTLARDRADRDSLKSNAEFLRRSDPSRSPLPVYMGDDVVLDQTAISPTGRWLLAVTTPKGYDAGRVGKMPMSVTESGYEEVEDTRTRVGRGEPAPETLWLVDLQQRTRHKLTYAPLPGIKADMLASVRAENQRERKTAASDTSKAKPDSAGAGSTERPLDVSVIAWNPQGTEAVVRLVAHDHKDCWLATVNLEKHALRPEQRLTDSAWVNWDYTQIGWLPDGRRFWFLSEETRYSHLYAKAPGSPAVALTSGRFEVSSPEVSPDGRWIYALSNAEAPYAYDVYRVPSAGGPLARLTRLQGCSAFGLSPDGTRLWVQHSATHTPTQLAVCASSGGAVRKLTDTRTAEYKAIRWPEPRIVAVPSSHGAGPIWSRLYLPADTTGLHPIVMFVHGAGYLQNTQLQFPYYFREQMFHHLLNERGYVVLDMDYRASQGYGRDWRTAIYRRMGTPELEDLTDGVRWLVRDHGGDGRRVGIYGGSYGGFMALMAMFKAPDVFQAGAALRPVTDWAQYNHGYTSAILNTPQIDSLAYRRSSPIEFAGGLAGPLLICHGMIDDNVLFEDSVRLYQRLIELHKNDVTLAPYPLDRHAFSHADSWLDEYKRIFGLFERMSRPVER